MYTYINIYIYIYIHIYTYIGYSNEKKLHLYLKNISTFVFYSFITIKIFNFQKCFYTFLKFYLHKVTLEIKKVTTYKPTI